MKATLIAAAILTAGIAQAQQPCALRTDIVAQLEQKYGERRVGAGLQNRGAVTEVFASAETGTWTIIQTRPDGVACAVAAGESWADERPAPDGDPS